MHSFGFNLGIFILGFILLNINPIFVILEVFYLEISGNSVKDLHPKNK